MPRAAGLSVALFLLLLLPPPGSDSDSEEEDRESCRRQCQEEEDHESCRRRCQEEEDRESCRRQCQEEEDRESCRRRCQEGNKKHDKKCCDKKHRCGCKTTTTAPSTSGAAPSPTPASATCCPGPSQFTTGSHGSLTSGAGSAPDSPPSRRAAISASLGTGVLLLLLLLLALLGALWHRRRTREEESAVRIEPGYVLAQAPQQVAGTGRQARPEHLYEEVGDPGSGGVREQSADPVARIGSEYALAQAPKIPAPGGN